MERPILTADRAELIINLRRINPGIDITPGNVSGETRFPADELAARLANLVSQRILEQETTSGGFNVYRFPANYQRGTMGPSN